jgi:hypothetical protein
MTIKALQPSWQHRISTPGVAAKAFGLVLIVEGALLNAHLMKPHGMLWRRQSDSPRVRSQPRRGK